MLMQPQSPTPQYDFILNNQPAPKKFRPLPGPAGPARNILIAVLAVFLVVLLAALLLGGRSGSTQPIINVMARNQEISRVSTLVGQQSKDPTTQALVSTVNSSLGSDKARLAGYLKSSKQKYDTKSLAADLNKNTDSQMQAAAQNGTLDTAYKTYLKSGLGSYKSDLQTAYTSAGSNASQILTTAFSSTQVILDTL